MPNWRESAYLVDAYVRGCESQIFPFQVHSCRPEVSPRDLHFDNHPGSSGALDVPFWLWLLAKLNSSSCPFLHHFPKTLWCNYHACGLPVCPALCKAFSKHQSFKCIHLSFPNFQEYRNQQHPIPGVSYSKGMGWRLKTCISNKLPGDLSAAGHT